MNELVAGEMRRLKDLSGLSFAKLAARTHYSRSSWERFLNGKKPVPRQAVEQFASVMGDGAGALLLMREAGSSGGSDGFGEAGGTAAVEDDGRGQGTPRRRPSPAELFAAGVAVGALAVAAAGLLAERAGGARRPFLRCPCATELAGVPRAVSHGVPSVVPDIPRWWEGAYDG